MFVERACFCMLIYRIYTPITLCGVSHTVIALKAQLPEIQLKGADGQISHTQPPITREIVYKTL